MDAVADRPSGRRPARRASSARGSRTAARRACATAAGRAARPRRGRPPARRRARPARGPSAARPPRAALPARVRANRCSALDVTARLRRGGDVALPPRQALAVLQPAQLLAPVAGDVAVGADRQRHAGGEPAGQVGEAVAEVRLGARAEHDAGAAPRHRGDLAGVAVGGVDELPARIEQALARQPFDRPRAGGGEAVAHLRRLLGDVDVDRPGEALGQPAQLGDRLGAGGAQRMDRQAGAEQRPARRRDRRGRLPDLRRPRLRKRRWSSRSGVPKPARS